MHFTKPIQHLLPLSLCLPLLAVTSCGDGHDQAPAKGPVADSDNDGHDHPPGEGHEDEGGHDDHGPMLTLGTQKIGTVEVAVARAEGGLEGGSESSVDITTKPVQGSTSAVSTVRVWIGTESAKGSMKAKAELEDEADPNQWHAHVEVPTPLPNGSKLWVEVTDEKGMKSQAGYELGS